MHFRLFVLFKYNNSGLGSSYLVYSPSRKSTALSLQRCAQRFQSLRNCGIVKKCYNILETLGPLKVKQTDEDTSPYRNLARELYIVRPYVRGTRLLDTTINISLRIHRLMATLPQKTIPLR